MIRAFLASPYTVVIVTYGSACLVGGESFVDIVFVSGFGLMLALSSALSGAELDEQGRFVLKPSALVLRAAVGALGTLMGLVANLSETSLTDGWAITLVLLTMALSLWLTRWLKQLF